MPLTPRESHSSCLNSLQNRFHYAFIALSQGAFTCASATMASDLGNRSCEQTSDRSFPCGCRALAHPGAASEAAGGRPGDSSVIGSLPSQSSGVTSQSGQPPVDGGLADPRGSSWALISLVPDPGRGPGCRNSAGGLALPGSDRSSQPSGGCALCQPSTVPPSPSALQSPEQPWRKAPI